MIELAQLARYQENNRLEAKRAQGGMPHSLWETYSAFANTVGGALLLGVIETPDKHFQAVPLPDPQTLCDQFWQIAANPELVSVNLLQRDQVQIVTAQNHPIVLIEDPRALACQKPVFLGSSPFSGTYRRGGEGDYRCQISEVQIMMQNRFRELPDGAPVISATLDDLKPASIHAYRQSFLRANPGSVWNAIAELSFLLQINAVYFAMDGSLHPTSAGLLMFGREEALARVFPGLELSNHLETGRREENACDFYFSARRQLQSQHPQEVAWAINEALVNALAHADYQDHPQIEIRANPQEVQVVNRGQLNRRALPANPVLYQMFHLIKAADGRGTGLLRIEAIWKQKGWCAPELTAEPQRREVLFRLPVSRKIQKRQTLQQRVLDLITTKIEISADQLETQLRLTKGQTETLLQQLLEQDLIELDPAGQRYRLKA